MGMAKKAGGRYTKKMKKRFPLPTSDSYIPFPANQNFVDYPRNSQADNHHALLLPTHTAESLEPIKFSGMSERRPL